MIIDGKKIRDEKIEILKQKISVLKEKPVLAVIQVGDNPASNVYIKQKKNLSEKVGMKFIHAKLDADNDYEALYQTIIDLNNNDKVNGIILQLPLPVGYNEEYFVNLISEKKDVDGLTDKNQGKLWKGNLDMSPCTPKGVITLLKEMNIPIASKKVVIVGRSILVGKPMAALFLNENATVTITHSKTLNLKEETKSADILVAAVGKPLFIKEDMIKDGAVLIDVGINRLEDGKLVGDIDFLNVLDKCSYITPVPGGVGPMTVYSLIENTYNAYLEQKETTKRLIKK